jgi:hypothetical protein
VARGDAVVVQNLVEKRKQMVVNITQNILKVTRDGSTSGIVENIRDALLLGHLHRHPPVRQTTIIHTQV